MKKNKRKKLLAAAVARKATTTMTTSPARAVDPAVRKTLPPAGHAAPATRTRTETSILRYVEDDLARMMRRSPLLRLDAVLAARNVKSPTADR